jgi:hypothetical protein
LVRFGIGSLFQEERKVLKGHVESIRFDYKVILSPHFTRPIIFFYNGNSYQANFTLATLLDDLATTQNTSISTNPNMSIQAPPSQMAASTRNENQTRSKQATTSRQVATSRMSTTSNLNNTTVANFSVIENEKTLLRSEEKPTTKKANKF